MNLEFEYGNGMMRAELPDTTDVFIPGETVPDPPCLPQDWDSLYAATLESIRHPIGMEPLRELAEGKLRDFLDSMAVLGYSREDIVKLIRESEGTNNGDPGM